MWPRSSGTSGPRKRRENPAASAAESSAIADPEELEPVLSGVRIFAGYAGWDAGQLDDELGDGSWLIASGLPSDLLAPATVDVWHEVLRRQQWPLPLLATYPVDPLTN